LNQQLAMAVKMEHNTIADLGELRLNGGLFSEKIISTRMAKASGGKNYE